MTMVTKQSISHGTHRAVKHLMVRGIRIKNDAEVAAPEAVNRAEHRSTSSNQHPMSNEHRHQVDTVAYHGACVLAWRREMK